MSAVRSAVAGLVLLLLAVAAISGLSLATSAAVSIISPPVDVGPAPATQSGRFWERPTTASVAPGAVAQAARRRARELRQAMPSQGTVPASLVAPVGRTADPNISLGAALFQVPRVAEATGLSTEYLRGLVLLGAARGLFNLAGPRYVNVVWLDHQVDAVLGPSHR